MTKINLCGLLISTSDSLIALPIARDFMLSKLILWPSLVLEHNVPCLCPSCLKHSQLLSDEGQR